MNSNKRSRSFKTSHTEPITKQRSKRSNSSIFSLPLEVLQYLLGFVPVRDAFQCCVVCRTWNNSLSLNWFRRTFFDADLDLPQDQGFTKEYLRTIIISLRYLPPISSTMTSSEVSMWLRWSSDEEQPRSAIRIINTVDTKIIRSSYYSLHDLFALGSVELAKAILKIFPDINIRRNSFKHAAKHTDVMHLLLDSWPAENSGNEEPPMAFISKCGDVALYERAAKLFGPFTDDEKLDILHHSIGKKTPTHLFWHLLNESGWLPPYDLELATINRAIKHRPELVEALLKRGGPLSEESVTFCMSYGTGETMELLFKFGATLSPDAILGAVRENVRSDVLEVLIKHGTGRWTNERGESALYHAVAQRWDEMVKLLLPVSDKHGFNLQGLDLIDMAAGFRLDGYRNEETNDSEKDKNPHSPHFTAKFLQRLKALDLNLEILKAFLEDPQPIKDQSYSVEIAVAAQSSEAVKLLLDYGFSAKGNPKRAKGWRSPLKYSVKNFEIARMLVEAGADPLEEPDLLQLALTRHSFKVAGMFLSRGVPNSLLVSTCSAVFARNRLKDLKLSTSGKKEDLFKRLFQGCIDEYEASVR
eukprot:TRINITY_DN9489_c1_g1_i2.p1 TRINITY_DN9489_c1_g1~~TRINITY_DN9489_c1_g1_i2.p1  ORF type:complete len:596 (-),score=55.01 TRINITY_DN9489_c1_g1_i2:51-1808(-)